jgi:hypothetical protein
MGKSKPVACGTVTSSPSYGRSTSSSLLLTVASFTGMMTFFIVYVDNGIFLGSSDQQLRGIINELWNLKLSIEDQGHPADYVGVSIKKLKDGIIELTQQALIDSIIADVALGNSKVKPIPAKVSKILHVHLDKPPFLLNFGY